jgi:hypothetical protein
VIASEPDTAESCDGVFGDDEDAVGEGYEKAENA